MRKKRNVELNGPTNILAFLDFLLENKRITAADHKSLVRETKKTLTYITKLANPDAIKWYDMHYELEK